MSDQRGTILQPVHASSSVKKAFRFTDLPGEVRNKIYCLCLINESSIPLEILELCHTETQTLEIAGRPVIDPLVFLKIDSDLEKWTVIANLLRVNKAVRDEASSIFYGCNIFQFLRPQCWIHFLYFDWNLTNVTYQHLRYLEIGFPPIERTVCDKGIVSHFSEIGGRGLRILEGLPSLENITFHLREDVMNSDIGLLRKIRRSCKGCGVVLKLGKVEVYDVRRPYSRRAVKISSDAVEGMRNWGWEVKGECMEVDQNHVWRDEHQWLEALQESSRWGSEFGLIHEPDFWSKTSFFRLAGLSK